MIVVVFHHALNGPPNAVIPRGIQRSFQIANISSAIHREPVCDGEMSTLGYQHQNILEPPVFGVDINMIMAKQNLAPLKTGIMYDDV